ncbi:MAG TPA: hypothetical protein VF278_19350 [Pirellulales bacterium]
MWDEQKSARFRELRSRDRVRLSENEQHELLELTSDLEAAEAAYLAPAAQRFKREGEQMESQIRSLQVLVQRKRDFVRRLRTFLTEAESERDARCSGDLPRSDQRRE